MKSKILEKVMERANAWPQADQAELTEYALEIEARQHGPYWATHEELKAIDEAIAAVRRGEVATDEEMEAIWAKYRPA